jgi:hypothetical protein
MKTIDKNHLPLKIISVHIKHSHLQYTYNFVKIEPELRGLAWWGTRYTEKKMERIYGVHSLKKKVYSAAQRSACSQFITSLSTPEV